MSTLPSVFLRRRCRRNDHSSCNICYCALAGRRATALPDALALAIRRGSIPSDHPAAQAAQKRTKQGNNRQNARYFRDLAREEEGDTVGILFCTIKCVWQNIGRTKGDRLSDRPAKASPAGFLQFCKVVIASQRGTFTKHCYNEAQPLLARARYCIERTAPRYQLLLSRKPRRTANAGARTSYEAATALCA